MKITVLWNVTLCSLLET